MRKNTPQEQMQHFYFYEKFINKHQLPPKACLGQGCVLVGNIFECAHRAKDVSVMPALLI